MHEFSHLASRHVGIRLPIVTRRLRNEYTRIRLHASPLSFSYRWRHATEAGGVGFEPTDELPHHRFSRPTPSSTRPPSHQKPIVASERCGKGQIRVSDSSSGPVRRR